MSPLSVVAQSAPPRILLVEDDDAVRRSLQLLLVAQGYDVRAYRSGKGLAEDPEALKAACLLADLITPLSSQIQHSEPWLTLHGLRLVYEKNA